MIVANLSRKVHLFKDVNAIDKIAENGATGIINVSHVGSLLISLNLITN